LRVHENSFGLKIELELPFVNYLLTKPVRIRIQNGNSG
jgi:hypothetical protein